MKSSVHNISFNKKLLSKYENKTVVHFENIPNSVFLQVSLQDLKRNQM